jgi:hypothetical protein
LPSAAPAAQLKFALFVQFRKALDKRRATECTSKKGLLHWKSRVQEQEIVAPATNIFHLKKVMGLVICHHEKFLLDGSPNNLIVPSSAALVVSCNVESYN